MPAAPKTMLFLSGLSTLFIVGAGSAILGPAVPVYEQAFNLSTATSGLLVSTLWIGCLTGVLSMYFKGAQIEPRPPLALVVVGSVLMAVAPAFWVALLGALIFGIGYGAIAALFNARVLHAFGTRGASRIGMLNALYSLGAIIAPYGFTLMGASFVALSPDHPLVKDLAAADPKVAAFVEECRRIGTTEEFGATAAFLCSPLAAYVTGSLIRLDGGAIKAI